MLPAGIIVMVILILTFIISVITECVCIYKKFIAGPAEFIGAAQRQDGIQKIVYEKYKFLIPKGRMSFHDFCYPDKYSVQPQQKFAGEWMAPTKSPKEMLVYHKIGAGKTCLAIQVAERWITRGNPLIIMPASLIPGFRNELRSECATGYITDDLRAELKTMSTNSPRYREIIEKSDEIINKNYSIMSYNKFLTDGENINAPLIIIDEVQNINNVRGKFFNAALSWILAHPAASVVIMSGTPLFDTPGEIHGLAKLLRIKDQEIILPSNIPKLFDGKISYFAGAPAFTFPAANIKIKQCLMSKFQAHWYKSEVAAEMKKYDDKSAVKLNVVSNDFYIKSRQRSNVTYPEGLVGTNGISAMTLGHLTKNLSTYSTKIEYMVKKILKNKLSFVYSGFTGYGGIKFVIKVLAAFGYKDYFKDGPGSRRYAVWSGDQNARVKDAIRAVFNSAANDDSSQLQLVIGSPSIKEGVTLLRLRQIHVLEAYWNHSRLEQIFGRGVRYCSHKSLPKDERFVDIYIYAAVTRKVMAAEMRRGSVDADVSIDLYMLTMADEKRAKCEEYAQKMIDCAVDKFLWQ